MSLYKTKLNNKRSRKLKNIDNKFLKEIKTSVILSNEESLKTIGTKHKQTIAKPNSTIKQNYLFPMLYDLSYIEDYAWAGFPEQRKKAEANKQDWIDDLYLKSLDIIYTNYVSKKYGFDCYNRKTGELMPGKTSLNKVIKRLHSVSGTRINFLSQRLILKGVQHYKDSSIYDKHLDQYNYVKTLPRNSSERRLYIPSKWLDYLINDIVAIESKHLYFDKEGNELVDKKKVKKDLDSLLTYERYKDNKIKLKEIIENFKVDSKEPLKFKLH